jgi:hypothetical protein
MSRYIVNRGMQTKIVPLTNPGNSVAANKLAAVALIDFPRDVHMLANEYIRLRTESAANS